MHRADETPGLWKELPHSGRLHLSEVLSSVDGPEMGQVPGEVELVCNDGEASRLLEVKLGPGDQVSSGEEVLNLLANSCLGVHDLLQVVGVPY